MTDTAFSVANLAALAGWALLLFLPRWRWTQTVAALAIPLLLALAYLAAFAAGWGATEGGFDSIAAVRALFADDRLLLAGWLHYLAFDLFVGAWEVREAERRGIPHLLVVPALVLTFLVGPVGFLVFHVVAAIHARRQKESVA